ncbi:N-acetyltransferase [Planotetraspora kaengkrachanensis]|uniref:N-acetyltransferase n=1 Tax=Planotetraspora kaengkrachanensis TaxID=575193 RepID=A0A8J3M9G0_9ACTN|nr:N-acetyltransferase [Planotetraspora kaengkrachanensis]GIG80700.1 hypothetical protein Pka01_38270 [Planotetraspora kaengkrachanensis]
MDLVVSTLAERPELAHDLFGMPTAWPEFMFNDPIAALYYSVAVTDYPEFVLVATIDGGLAAKALSVPLRLGGDPLPAGGWDEVVMRAWRARLRGDRPDAVSALEISIRPDVLGRGLSAVMLAHLRDQVAALGFAELLAPVRPNAKHLEPWTPMSEYAWRTRDDGLPHDPWLRVHVRAGGVVDRVAPRSMVIPGTLAEWRRWTGLPFDRAGRLEVPGALSPVHVDLEADQAVYVEPNVWVRHALR